MAKSEQDVLIELFEPLYAQVSGGQELMKGFLAEGDGAAVAKRMLSALKLVNVGADGSVTAASDGADEPMIELPKKVTNSLKTALAKQDAKAVEEIAASQELKPGQKCQRKNCGSEWTEGYDPEANECVHCPGMPVFHEGYKYWSCCPKKKTYDFDEFLDMKGCETTKCCQWFKDPDAPVEEKQCRYDFFQTPNDVTLSVFAKCADPEQTTVLVNSTKISVETIYERSCAFKLSFKMAGTVDPSSSSVTFMSGKIDIKLKKTDGKQWPCLEAGAA